MPLMIVLGILLIVAGLWNLAVPHLTSMEGIQANVRNQPWPCLPEAMCAPSWRLWLSFCVRA